MSPSSSAARNFSRMRVSAAAWSRVIPFFSRCARRKSPRRDTVLCRSGVRRDAVHLAEFARPAIGPDDTAALHLVDEAARTRESDGHLALQHGDGSLPLGCNDLDGLLVTVVVRLVAVDLPAGQPVGPLDDLLVAVVAQPGLLDPVVADVVDLVVRDEHALRPDRLREVRTEHEHVAAP